jgi:serine/threonine protein kinase
LFFKRFVAYSQSEGTVTLTCSQIPGTAFKAVCPKKKSSFENCFASKHALFSFLYGEASLSSAAIESNHHAAMLTPGAILQDRYRIVRPLGKGGMGAVYEAIDQRLDTTVALKETFSEDDRLRRQFEQEARLLAQLNHSALPRVSDYFTEGNRAFLVMQFVAGVDLAEIIARQPGPFPQNQVVAWADQLLDALIYLHTRDRQIIHRDIKPHNLKLNSAGKISLLDFGLAKAQSTDASGNSSVSIFGYTRRYAPLEQIQDQGTTPQSDLYALGATLYHLLTGIKPPDALARAAALVNGQPDPLKPAHEIQPSVGAEIAGILCRAMAQNPLERYASASDFREALWRVGRSEPLVQSSPPNGETTVAGASRSRGNDPFEGYSILKPAETPWLLPAEKRGPGVIAGLLIFLLSVVAASFYGYRHWVAGPGSEDTTTVAVPRSGGTSNGQSRPDKPHANASGVTSSTPVAADEAGRKKIDVERNESREHPGLRADNLVPNSPVATLIASRERSVETARKVSFPHLRLPSTDLKVDGPTRAPERLPVYGQLSSQPEPVQERQVLRAADGTQVVKFSDGTTRTFRPGEKNPQTGNAPQ